MTVAELLARISSRELSEWMAFYNKEPFGSNTQYYGPAIVAKTVADVHRTKKSKSIPLEDFMPKFEEKKSQSTDEMLQFATMHTIASGGKVGE